MAEKKSFILFTDYKKNVNQLSDEEAGQLFKAILSYSDDGTKPELDRAPDICFTFIQTQLDRDSEKWNEIKGKRVEAGKKGGVLSGIARSTAKQNEANPSKPKQNEANEAVSVSASVSGSVNGSVSVNEIEDIPPDGGKRPPPKKKYGTYLNVKLTDDDIEKLKSEYPQDWETRIERLSEYIASKGDKYKSHIATIRSWARKDEAQPINGQAAKPYAPQYNSNPFSQILREMEENEANTFYQGEVKEDE